MSFQIRLKAEREQRDITQKQLADIIGVTDAAIGMWERGKRIPDTFTLQRLADYFGVTVDYLLGRTETIKEKPVPYGDQEIHLLPILGVIRAGQPLYADENIVGYEPIGADQVKGGDYFYLRVTGNSMFNPSAGKLISDGSLVLVRQQDDVDNGVVAVVMVNEEEATVKRVFKNNGQIVLQADNTSYPPLILSKGNVKIIGKVIRSVTEVK